MNQPFHYQSLAMIPTVVLYLVAVVGVYVWVRLYSSGYVIWRNSVLLNALLRIMAGFAALTLVSQALQRTLIFATSWPLWPLWLAGAAAVEGVIFLYKPERDGLAPRSVGMFLSILRALLVLMLIFMLSQPVWSWERIKTVNRKVAILVDTSPSMGVPDNGATPAEKIRLAQTLGLAGVGRSCPLIAQSRRLKDVQQKLTAQADWVATLSGKEVSAVRQELRSRHRDLEKTLTTAMKEIVRQTNDLAEVMASPAVKVDTGQRAVLVTLSDTLANNVHTHLTNANQQLKFASQDRPGSNLVTRASAILNHLQTAATTLADLDPKLAAAAEQLDDASYRSLPESDRHRIDQIALKKRVELARDMLCRPTRTPDDKQDILIARLRKMYGVRLYTFASQPTETDEKGLNKIAGAAARVLTNSPGQITDIATALEQVTADTPASQLVGILLLTDGNHNGQKPVEPVARGLGLQPIPVSAVVFGGNRRPPIDVAVVSVKAPEAVSTNDRVEITAFLKLDGVTESNVTVNLYRNDQIVSTQKVAVVADRVRTSVLLADQARTNGLTIYRVAVQPVSNEVVLVNNQYEFPVGVTDDQIRLLLVDGWPRWEFRYLKNLFTSRDVAVRLQYILFHPVQITNAPPRQQVTASAARPADQPEATLFPANEEEWMKFDVLILGDVEPALLGPAEIEIIRKFVVQRGGSLVVVAGSLAMPHAFAQTPLGELLPVTVTPSDQPAPTPDDGYRLMLTAEGRESPLLRLATDPAQNLSLWNAMPDLYWRHETQGLKPGATMLAYALPLTPPPFMRPKCEGEVPDADILRQRRQFELDHPLIVTHQVGAGRVMYLGFDQTWRFRYHTGDILHHKFWGQTLRWAAADKLPFGTGPIRLGTDQLRYAPGSAVRVRARLMKPDNTPVTGVRLTVQCARRTMGNDTGPILRKELQPVPGSVSMMAADLGLLPEGQYRVELDAGKAAALVGVTNTVVAAEFAVLPAYSPELVELAANHGLLSRLAGLTGGRIVDPPQIREALEAFGPPELTRHERHEYHLWNSWAFFIIMIMLVGIEWLVRKQVRLP